MAATFKVAAIFEGFDRMTRPVRAINNSLDRLTKKAKVASLAVSKSSQRMGAGFKNMVSGVIGASVAIAAFRVGVIGTIRSGAEFEKALVTAGAKFGRFANVVQGTEAFQRIEKAAAQAGRTTEFSATQAAEGLNFLAVAGLKVDQAISALPGVIDLATATNLELARAADISTDALGAFGIKINQLDAVTLKAKMTEINDILVLTSNSFNLSVEQMFEVIKKGGPVLTQLLSVSSQQFAVFSGVLANSGIKAELAGTQLRGAFLRMAGGVPAVKKAMKSLGVSIEDKSTGKIKDAITILDELRTGLNKIESQKKRTEVAGIIFGTRGVSAMTTLLAESTESLRVQEKAIKAAGGETKRVADLIRSTVIGSWFKFTSALNGLALIIFKKLKPTFNFLLDSGIKITGLFTKAAVPLLKLAKLIIMVTIVTKAWAFTQLVLNRVLLANPLFLLIGLLVTLTVMFPELSEQVLDLALIFADFIKPFAGTIFKAIAAVLGFIAVWKVGVLVMALFTKGWILLKGLFVVFQGILLILKAGFIALNTVMFLNPIGLITLGVIGLIAAIVALVVWFDEIIDFFKAGWFSVSSLLDPFTSFLAILIKVFPDSISKMLGKVKNMFGNLFKGIKSFFGFGDEEPEVNVNKETENNINDRRKITPSPAAQAAGSVNGQIDVNFNNRPENVEVRRKVFQNETGLVLAGTG
jgi:TP901 family phage tail tape measure protein